MKQNSKIILYCLLISCLFLYPYLIQNTLNLEHDTLFHLSRIEGVAQSLKEGKIFFDIYPYKNGGFGYGSALFYCDLFLIPVACLYLCGISISICYKINLLIFTFLSAYTMFLSCKEITKHPYAPYLAAFLYLFSNYRITDVYVRGSMGEIMAFAFLPLVILAFWQLLQKQYSQATKNCIISFSGLILTHNITFFLACILFASLLLTTPSLLKKKQVLRCVLLAVLIVTGITAFFTFGMLEQLFDHKMIVHYYGSSSDLSASALYAWQFFINQTIFGLAGNTGNPDQLMVTNPGWFLTFIPLLNLLKIKKQSETEQFILYCQNLGYFFLFLCSAIIPWKALSFLNIIQFPWRFMSIAIVLLCIPASYALFDFFKKEKLILTLALLIGIFNVITLINPVLSRTFVLKDEASYSSINDGSLIDPYYSANYMRTELAGADYLPWPYKNFKTTDWTIQNMDYQTIETDLNQNFTTLTFTLENPHSTCIAPLTWYKGYQAYWLDGTQWVKLDTSLHYESGLVQFEANNKIGQFKIVYEKTKIQKMGMTISALTLFLLCFPLIKRWNRKKVNFLN